MAAVTAPAATGGTPKLPWAIAPVVAMAAFMEVLDISIANVALDHIAGNLSASVDEATWVLTSYLVTNAIVLPISGWLSTRLGRKRFFMSCIVGFSISSLACGLAPTLAILILFRAIQGLTGGGLQPVAQAILADTFPPKQRGIAFGIFGMAVVAAPAIGPTLGGYITDNVSWRWVFLLNVPVGIILYGLVQRMISDPPAQIEERMRRLRSGGTGVDYVGFALLTIGMGALQVVLDRGQQDDWFGSHLIVAFTIISTLGFLFFAAWELWVDEPIVELRLLENPNFAAGFGLMFMLGFILLATTQLIPQFTQQLLGYTATQAGLVISPGGFAIMLMMPIVGRLVGIVDPRLLICAGIATSAAALWHMSGFDLGVDYWTLAVARIYQAMGLAFLFIPITTISYVGVPPEKNNQASALINLARNLGGSVGISIMNTMLARHDQLHRTRLAEHLYAYRPEVVQQVDALRQRFIGQGMGPHEALQHAYARIGFMLNSQSRMLSYVDAFAFLAVVFAAMLLMLLFVKKPPEDAKAPAGAH